MKRSGNYQVTVTLDPAECAGAARFQLNGTTLEAQVTKGATECRFEKVTLREGPGQLRAFVACGAKPRGARFVEIRLT